MAEGIEVVLGWAYPDFVEASKVLEVKLPKSERDWNAVRKKGTYTWLHDNGTFKLNDRVEWARKEMLLSAGYRILDHQDNGHLLCSTPWGERRFSKMVVELFYDWNNMHEKPEDTVFGVSLSGRYLPVFLDARSLHGAIYHFILNKDTQKMIAIAKRALSESVPGFKTAYPIVVQKHY